MIILGLDLSTSITGATVLDREGNTLLCESWDTRNKNKFPLLFHKAQFVRKNLFGLQYPITKIYIEQPFTFLTVVAQRQKLWPHCKDSTVSYRGFATTI